MVQPGALVAGRTMFGISRKTGVAVLGAFGAVALGAGVATAVTAASIPSSDGTITGCYVTASNSLKSFYLIDKQSGAHCPPDRKSVV